MKPQKSPLSTLILFLAVYTFTIHIKQANAIVIRSPKDKYLGPGDTTTTDKQKKYNISDFKNVCKLKGRQSYEAHVTTEPLDVTYRQNLIEFKIWYHHNENQDSEPKEDIFLLHSDDAIWFQLGEGGSDMMPNFGILQIELDKNKIHGNDENESKKDLAIYHLWIQAEVTSKNLVYVHRPTDISIRQTDGKLTSSGCENGNWSFEDYGVRISAGQTTDKILQERDIYCWWDCKLS